MSSVVNQQFDRVAIEAIVREVLRRLTGVGSTGNVANNQCVTLNSIQAQQKQQSFECSDKVISTETLRDKLNNIKTLRVKPKTIVTPAVRDELRDRKITIVFDLGTDNPNHRPATILLGTTCASTGNRLRDQLVAGGTQVQLHVDSCSSQLTTFVGDQVSMAMSALIVTEKPYKAACTANRNANVRAVVINNTNELTAAKAELNPNCVVLNSSNVGRINLSNLLSQLN